MWSDLSNTDFTVAPGCILAAFGVVSPSFRNRLKPFVDQLTARVDAYSRRHEGRRTRIHFISSALVNAFARLSYPATMTDLTKQVVLVQRFWLEGLAWLTWVEDKHQDFNPAPSDKSIPFQPQFMGAYTTDPAVVQRLLHAGVPVWLLRAPELITTDTIIRKVVEPTRPTHINTSNPRFTVYVGKAGEAALAATCMGGHSYHDVEQVPLHNPDVRSAPSTSAVIGLSVSPLSLLPIQVPDITVHSSLLATPVAVSSLSSFSSTFRPQHRPSKPSHSHNTAGSSQGTSRGHPCMSNLSFIVIF